MAIAPLPVDDEQARDEMTVLMGGGADIADLMLVPRPGWMKRGACRWHPEIDFFTRHSSQVDRAKAVCATCPVQSQCLAYALDRYETEGVWGGMTYDERRKLLPRRGPGRPRKRPLAVVAE